MPKIIAPISKEESSGLATGDFLLDLINPLAAATKISKVSTVDNVIKGLQNPTKLSSEGLYNQLVELTTVLSAKFPRLHEHIGEWINRVNHKAIEKLPKLPEYKDYITNVKSALSKMYPDGNIPVRRVVGFTDSLERLITRLPKITEPRYAISVSMYPKWGGLYHNRPVIGGTVSIDDVIAFGTPDEFELLVKPGSIKDIKVRPSSKQLVIETQKIPRMLGEEAQKEPFTSIDILKGLFRK